MVIMISEKVARIIKNRKRLEKILNVKISNNGREVTFTGQAEDEFVAGKVLSALEVGFSFADAVSIKEQELDFDLVPIKNFARRGNLEKIRGRIIGRGGRALATLSELTKCSFEIKNNEIGVIGEPDRIKPAIDAIAQIIRGSKHANVYKGLEKRKEEPLIDLGLRQK